MNSIVVSAANHTLEVYLSIGTATNSWYYIGAIRGSKALGSKGLSYFSIQIPSSATVNRPPLWTVGICLTTRTGGRSWGLYCNVLHLPAKSALFYQSVRAESGLQQRTLYESVFMRSKSTDGVSKKGVSEMCHFLRSIGPLDGNTRVVSLETEEEPLEQKVRVVSLPSGTRSLRE